MTTAIEYALLAGASYFDTRTDKNRFSLPQDWSVLFRVSSDPITGFEATAFQNGNEIVISYAGTYGTGGGLLTNPDKQADLAMGLGAWSAQLGQAADYYLSIKNNPLYQGSHITLTGHSLGGGLASLIAVFFGETAFTFDQAPFAETAKFQAQALMNYLVSEVDALGQPKYTTNQLAGLTNYIAQQQANITLITPIPNQNLVTNISVEGQLLADFPYSMVNTIGSEAQPNLASSHAGVAGEDLHSQALLTAFLQSDATATTSSGQKQSLSQVTYKLTELLKMIFDKTLFAYDTDKLTDKENFIDRLVRHEFGNAPNVTTADAMVTRFTSDLWKLAQDGGMTLTDQNTSNPDLHELSKALTAFAMQFYYENTANAVDTNKQLFTDLSQSGTGSNGIRFDLHDVSKDIASAMDANHSVDLTQAKGYRYFKDYLAQTNNGYIDAEKQLITSLLPYMRDWYVQAGNGGMMATDTLNRGAFMLGGKDGDALVGGTAADLLVGNGGADTLEGKGGNDTLLGGDGNDLYKYTHGGGNTDGLDTILDKDNNGSIQIDGQAATGGDQYGDNKVFRAQDANGVSHLYTFVTGDRASGGDLMVDGAMLIKNYNPSAGNHMGISFADAVTLANPVITRDIVGDIAPIDFDLNTAGLQIHTDDLGNIVMDANTPELNRADYFEDSIGNDHIMAGGGDDIIGAWRGGDNLIEGGAGNDSIETHGGNDVVMGGTGNDGISGGAGDDRLYANMQISVADAIAQGNTFSLNGSMGSGLKGDWMDGGSGDDTLIGNADNEVLAGGGGNDLLIGGEGDDYLLGDSDYMPAPGNPVLVYTMGGVSAWAHPWDSNWQVISGANDVYTFMTDPNSVENPADSGNDVIYAGNGNDKAWGGYGNDVIFGEAGDDLLIGDLGNDILLGGTDADKLWGGDGSDYLSGGDGIDTLLGDAGDDILIGGAGNDTLRGGAGRDTYLFGRNDGTDHIIDAGIDNVMRFGEGIGANDITLRIGSLMLDLGNGDAVHIDGFNSQDVFNSSSISSFEFADGTTLTKAELLAKGFDINGTEGDDKVITTTDGNGVITIIDHKLYGTNTTDRIHGLGGNDYILSGEGDDILDGGTGDDQLQGAEGNDKLIGGVGNDALIGETGNDVYTFNRGDGQDTIDNTDALGATDTLRFGAGIADTDLLAFQSGNHLLLKINGSTDQIAFYNYYAANTVNGSVVSDHKIDRVEFANGVVWDQAMIQSVVDRATNNHAPTVSTTLPVLETRAGYLFTYTVPLDAIIDSDAWDSITYTVKMPDGSPLPAWLSFDAATRTLSGVSTTADIGSLQFVLWGTDNYGYSTGENVTLNITANHAPILSVALVDQAVLGGTLNYTVPMTTFSDSDAGDTLSYSATLADGSVLPSWLIFDPITLTFSGSPITVGTTSVRVTVIDAGNLNSSDVFDIVVTAQNLAINGTAGNDTLNGGLGNDTINGLAGNDVLNGYAGDDILDGGAGADVLQGGLGNDTYVVDNIGDVVTENLNEGIDTVQSSITYTLEANVENLALAGTTAINATGNTLNNTLDGSQNSAVNTLAGGTGNDIYIVGTDDIVSETSTVATEIDTVQIAITYTLTANVENLILSGTAAVNGTGNVSSNVITGNIAANTLSGGAGADTMIGGLGNDTYVVDNVADAVTENLNEGIDTVQSSIAYILGENVENLTLTGTSAINGAGNALNNILTGNAGDNWLNGGVGSDTLLGGGGNDTLDGGGISTNGTPDILAGGLGNDTYLFSYGSGQERITEVQNDVVGNVDTVIFGAGIKASNIALSFENSTNLILRLQIPSSNGRQMLDTGDYLFINNFFASQDSQWKVERFVFEDGTIWTPSDIANRFFISGATQEQDLLTGTILNDTLDGLGGDDVINGDTGNDALEGGAGNDYLRGSDGNDTLHGGVGYDFLNGGLDNDTYQFNLGDGVDTIIESTGSDTIILGAGVLTANVNLFRDGGDLILAVNGSAQNSLLIKGYFLAATNQIEQIIFADGTIWNTSAIPSLTVAGVANSMVGTAGNDTFIVDNAGDTITEAANQGVDTILTSASYYAPSNVENITATGYLNISLTATDPSVSNTITGNSGDNILSAGTLTGSGIVDTLIGGRGNDTYIVSGNPYYGPDAAAYFLNDVIIVETFFPNEIDTVICTNFSFSLSSYIENLTLKDTNINYPLTGIGNSLNNVLVGVDRYTIFYGVGGDDTLIIGELGGYLDGGVGSDTYVVSSLYGGVTIVETSTLTTEIDTVRASCSFSLATVANVENLTLTNAPSFNSSASGAINGTGNSLNNKLTGNTADNTLDGGLEADILIGGLGNDTYVVDNIGDQIAEYLNEGIDLVQTTISFVLTSNLEKLTLLGSAAINGAGNELDNTLLGNTANNILDGSLGADIMIGGLGNDIYVVDNIGDVVTETSILVPEIDVVQSAITYTLVANVENLTLTGANAINGNGNALNNLIVGNAADNVIDGGSGNDWAGYGNSASGVVVDLSLIGAQNTLGAGIDTLINIENILGGNFNDTLSGNLFNNVLNGGLGDDSLNGGDGNDWVYYDTASIGVTVNLNSTNAQNTLGAGVDTLINIENILGSNFNDNLTGSGLDNLLSGGVGSDTVNGGSGNDTLSGGINNDLLSGGDGNDTYLFSRGDGQDTVNDYSSVVGNVDTIRFDTGIVSSDITFKRLGNDLVLGIVGTTDQVTILNWGLGNDYQINRVEFADSTVWDSAALTDMTINHAPIVTSAIANQSLLQGQAFNLDVSGKFSDVDVVRSDILTFSAVQTNGAALPTWLTFNAATHTFTGTPDNADVGSFNLRVTVTDTDGLSANSDFVVDVANTNDAPILVNPIVAQSASQGDVFSYVLSAPIFTDIDAIYGDVLNYSATLANGNVLPAWLIFDAATKTFGGTPGSADVGSLSVKIIATDAGGLTASGTFALTINPPITVIMGTSGNDVLAGIADVEQLVGLAGNDILNGGAGADIMLGGTGDDIYVVENIGDVVTELVNEGIDTVQSSITYTLGDDVENLTLTGTTAINATGNALNNILTGNSAANVLTGGAGDDTYVVGTGDVIAELANEGIDTVSTILTYSIATLTNIENITLTGTTAINATGNALDNVLNGSINTKVNALTGGAGNDTYILGTGDTITEAANAGTDTVTTAATYTLATNLENLTLTGTAAVNGTGNTVANILTGNSAANTLNGGTGADTMIGGLGNDIYVVDNVGDVATETSALATEIDTVQSSITYSLATLVNVENLTLTGTTAINATGNTLNNVLTGNSAVNTLTGGAGDDTLNGGTGADTMIGGTGNDTYVRDNTGDVITELANEGIDTVSTSLTYSIATLTNIENITLTGTTAINATGNALDNVLNGSLNTKVNALTGGAGNDTYILGTGDTITEAANAGTDTVMAAATYTLATNLENLTLTGTAAVNGTGNTVDNVLVGNTAINTLTGGTGNDLLNGGLGNDSLNGGLGADKFVFNTSLSATNVDSIVGFATGSDAIQLDFAIFGGAGATGVLSSTAFASGAGMTDATTIDQHIIYNATSGGLYYDADGVGGVASVQFATLVGVPAVTAADFIVV